MYFHHGKTFTLDQLIDLAAKGLDQCPAAMFAVGLALTAARHTLDDPLASQDQQWAACAQLATALDTAAAYVPFPGWATDLQPHQVHNTWDAPAPQTVLALAPFFGNHPSFQDWARALDLAWDLSDRIAYIPPLRS